MDSNTHRNLWSTIKLLREYYNDSVSVCKDKVEIRIRQNY